MSFLTTPAQYTRTARTSRDITAEELRGAFHYDPDTGVFTRTVRTSGRIKVGDIAGSVQRGYLAFHVSGVLCRAHRMAWLYVHGIQPNGFLDHINGVRHDNRLANLREATPGQNCQNTRTSHANNKHGFKGVNFDPRRTANKFLAYLSTGRKRVFLGSFPTAQEAHQAYLIAKVQQHEYFQP